MFDAPLTVGHLVGFVTGCVIGTFIFNAIVRQIGRERRK